MDAVTCPGGPQLAGGVGVYEAQVSIFVRPVVYLDSWQSLAEEER